VLAMENGLDSMYIVKFLLIFRIYNYLHW
jgi:hypothetical protein